MAPALAIGAYYSILYSPWLLAVGLVELFFLFAYNLNLFDSRFHSENWFAFSWGFLPVIAGYVMQTDGINPAALAAGLFGFTTSYVEANASRPYKELKMTSGGKAEEAIRFEKTLKGVVACSLSVAAAMVLLRSFG